MDTVIDIKPILDDITCVIAQMDVEPGNPRANADWMINEIEKADDNGADLIVFPEMSVPGYILGDRFEYDEFVLDVFSHNDRVIATTAERNINVIFGTIVTDDLAKTGEDGRMRKINGGIVARNGHAVVGESGLPFFAKTNLPKYRMFDEVRHMTTLHELAAERNLEIDELLQPFELELKGQKVRVAIIDCEDGWIKDYRIKPPIILAAAGVDLFVNVSASPWGWQKNRARHEAFREYIAELGIPMIYANISGTQDNGKSIYPFDGASTIYNQYGEAAVVVEPHFSGVSTHTLDDTMPSIAVLEKDDRAQLYAGVRAGFTGLMKTIPPHMHRFSIALSGGLDSAVVMALEVLEVGTENVYPTNMPFGSHNSDRTKNSAQHQIDMHQNPHYQVHTIDAHVQPKLAFYGMSEDHPGLETIVALERKNLELGRARAIGGIALCTGNKTEIGYGFFCNDGDGRGAFAPLGDLYKGEVCQLAYYLNTEVFGKEVIPFELIDGGLPPMAELKPGMGKDPHDYGVVTRDGEFIRGYHDQMLHAFVGYRHGPEWFLGRFMDGDLEKQLLLHDGKLRYLSLERPAAFIADLESHWQAMHYNIWKRVQAPTNIAVSKRPFGFDNRESLLKPYYTDAYQLLKEDLLRQA